MSYSEKHFLGCRVNPLQKDLLNKNPRLSEIIPKFEDVMFEEGEIEKIMRYVILMYDPQSVLVKEERDLSRRKEQAAIIAELQDDEEYLNTVFNCEHKLVVPLTVGYLMRFAKSKEWAAIVATEAKYWESIAGIMQPVTGKSDKDRLQAIEVKSALSEEVDKDLVRLEEYEKKFYGDEIIQEKSKKRITPESIAA